MKTILILTVGGSHQPLVRSIQQNQPSFVYFLCSTDGGKIKGSYTQVQGEGKVCFSRPGLDAPDLPNIVQQAGLPPGQFEVQQIGDFDNLSACYLAAMQLIEQVHQAHPDARLLVDYTGGTKSMTAGLAAAALDDGRCEIQLVSGLRQDLVKVVDQTEFVRPVRVWDAQIARRIQAARQVLARFDYVGAARILEDAAARYGSDHTLEMLQRWLSLCRGFDAWDRFDHAAARQLLQPYRKHVIPYAKFLDAIVEGKGHGFEWVEDLIQNASRRAAQERFDDAVGRLYRALELTAQTWLNLRHGLETGNLDLARVPESQRERLAQNRNDKGIVQVGLRAAWELIAAFPDDLLGQAYQPQQNRLLSFLTTRNASLFAHGFTPIGASAYREHSGHVVGFLHQCIELAVTASDTRRSGRLDQFPTAWE